MLSVNLNWPTCRVHGAAPRFNDGLRGSCPEGFIWLGIPHVFSELVVRSCYRKSVFVAIASFADLHPNERRAVGRVQASGSGKSGQAKIK